MKKLISIDDLSSADFQLARELRHYRSKGGNLDLWLEGFPSEKGSRILKALYLILKYGRAAA